MPPRFLLPVLALLAVAPVAMAAAPVSPLLDGPGGTVFVAGGAVKQTDADLWGAYAGYARAARRDKRPKVVVFGTARPSDLGREMSKVDASNRKPCRNRCGVVDLSGPEL